MNRRGNRGDGDGGVHGSIVCVSVCAVRRRRCAERMWPEVMGKVVVRAGADCLHPKPQAFHLNHEQ